MEAILIGVPKKDFHCTAVRLVWKFNMFVTHTVTLNDVIDMCCMEHGVKLLK